MTTHCTECELPPYARGMCQQHYRAALRLERIAKAGPCVVDGCDRPGSSTGGLCEAHYQRQKVGASLDAPIGDRRDDWPSDACSHPGCERPRAQRGLCRLHYQRQRKERQAI